MRVLMMCFGGDDEHRSIVWLMVGVKMRGREILDKRGSYSLLQFYLIKSCAVVFY